MNEYEAARREIAKSYALLEYEPEDRLDYISASLKLTRLIQGCLTLVLNMRTHPEEYKHWSEEDLELIHSSLWDSASPLVKMMEHFLEIAISETEEKHFAV